MVTRVGAVVALVVIGLVPSTAMAQAPRAGAAAGCRLADLDVQVITTPTLRLDLPDDCAALERTVAQLAPRLLILDPFVRLHRIDENASGEVAPLLAYLRELQRRLDITSVYVTHDLEEALAISDRIVVMRDGVIERVS